MKKLSRSQTDILQLMAGGQQLRHYSSVICEEWVWSRSYAKVHLRTANSLADHGWIAPSRPNDLESEYVLTDAGRAALGRTVNS